MIAKYRHTPTADPERKRCPVCRQAVYSTAGIHPQCAKKRAVALDATSKRQAESEASCSVVAAITGTDSAPNAPVSLS